MQLGCMSGSGSPSTRAVDDQRSRSQDRHDAMEPAAMGPAAMGPAAMQPAAMGPAAMEPSAMEPAAMQPSCISQAMSFRRRAAREAA